MASVSKLQLPEAFLDFLNQNGLDPSIYTGSDSTPRYIRYTFSAAIRLTASLCEFVFCLFGFDGIQVF